MKINNKNPWEWEEDELQSLIDNKVSEVVDLEYKGSDSLAKTEGKKKEVSKDISAMANSNGGVVIYGIETYPEYKRKHIPKDFDNGVETSEVSIEWLEQVIYSNVQPRIEGLRIHPIELKRKSPDKFVYVIYVPKSDCAHQAGDKRYYGRIERTTTALEDYQIRDINSRLKYPVLQPKFRLTTVQKKDNETTYNWEIFLRNTGVVRARDWAFEIIIPREFQIKLGGDKYTTISPIGDGKVRITIDRGGAQQVIYPQYEPRIHIIHNVRISNRDLINLTQRGSFSWKIFADDAPPRSGKTKFIEIEIS